MSEEIKTIIEALFELRKLYPNVNFNNCETWSFPVLLRLLTNKSEDVNVSAGPTDFCHPAIVEIIKTDSIELVKEFVDRGVHLNTFFKSAGSYHGAILYNFCKSVKMVNFLVDVGVLVYMDIPHSPPKRYLWSKAYNVPLFITVTLGKRAMIPRSEMESIVYVYPEYVILYLEAGGPIDSIGINHAVVNDCTGVVKKLFEMGSSMPDDSRIRSNTMYNIIKAECKKRNLTIPVVYPYDIKAMNLHYSKLLENKTLTYEQYVLKLSKRTKMSKEELRKTVLKIKSEEWDDDMRKIYEDEIESVEERAIERLSYKETNRERSYLHRMSLKNDRKGSNNRILKNLIKRYHSDKEAKELAEKTKEQAEIEAKEVKEHPLYCFSKYEEFKIISPTKISFAFNAAYDYSCIPDIYKIASDNGLTKNVLYTRKDSGPYSANITVEHTTNGKYNQIRHSGTFFRGIYFN